VLTSKSKNPMTKERPLALTMKMAKSLGFLYSDDEDENIDRSLNLYQIAEETEGDKAGAGDEASGCVKPLESGDRYDSSDEELPPL